MPCAEFLRGMSPAFFKLPRVESTNHVAAWRRHRYVREPEVARKREG